jgi:hypothetical protein
MQPIKPKLDIFSLMRKKATMDAKIGSNEKIIPAFAGVVYFWNFVCNVVVNIVANIDV